MNAPESYQLIGVDYNPFVKIEFGNYSQYFKEKNDIKKISECLIIKKGRVIFKTTIFSHKTLLTCMRAISNRLKSGQIDLYFFSKKPLSIVHYKVVPKTLMSEQSKTKERQLIE